MALNSNSTNKIVDREQWNENSATRISSGGYITNYHDPENVGHRWDGKLYIVSTTGYIKKTLEDTVAISVPESLLEDILDVTTKGGDVVQDYDGIIAIVIDLESNVRFLEISSVDEDVDNSLYIQLATGYRDPVSGNIASIEYNYNCVLGDDVATTVKNLAEAIGRISNLKLRPCSDPNFPLNIETFVDQDELLSRFLYGSNSLKAFEENINIRHKTSRKMEKMHRPQVEVGVVDTLFSKKLGVQQPYQKQTSDAVLGIPDGRKKISDGRIRVNKFVEGDFNQPSGVLGDDEWVIAAVDMREADDTKVEGVDTDVSFLVSYDERVFGSRKEAYDNRSIVDRTTAITRLGWVIVCGKTKKLELDSEECWVGSTDFLGVQVVKPPYFSDKERAQDLSPNIATEYIFNNTGNVIMNREGHALRHS